MPRPPATWNPGSVASPNRDGQQECQVHAGFKDTMRKNANELIGDVYIDYMLICWVKIIIKVDSSVSFSFCLM